MKSMKKLLGLCVLTLCFTSSVFAGDIPAVGITAPLPQPSPVSESAIVIAENPSLVQQVVSGVLSLINAAGLLIP
jgi:hypothetical protein